MNKTKRHFIQVPVTKEFKKRVNDYYSDKGLGVAENVRRLLVNDMDGVTVVKVDVDAVYKK